MKDHFISCFRLSKIVFLSLDLKLGELVRCKDFMVWKLTSLVRHTSPILTQNQAQVETTLRTFDRGQVCNFYRTAESGLDHGTYTTIQDIKPGRPKV